MKLKNKIQECFEKGLLPIIFLNPKISKENIDSGDMPLLPQSNGYYSTDMLRIIEYYKNIDTGLSNENFQETQNE